MHSSTSCLTFLVIGKLLSFAPQTVKNQAWKTLDEEIEKLHKVFQNLHWVGLILFENQLQTLLI